jgi:site-specific DNA-methyltransferase (adenine-specific)
MNAPEKVVIGNAELWHGDCREVLPMLSHADVIVTDPPYGVSLAGKANKWRHALTGGYASFQDTEENVRLEVVPRFLDALRIVGRAVVTPGTRMAFDYPRPDAIGGVYNRCGAGSGKWGFECVAPILYFGKDPYLSAGLGRRPNGWEQPVNDYAEDCGHPCPKPIGMMEWLVSRASLSGETVLDIFMGSGTTGVAVANVGRCFVGIERERKYFDIACERISRAQAQGQLIPHETPQPKQEELL